MMLQVGDTVIIRTEPSLFDCCAGKRGRIAHKGVGGGWLLNTDHFCPVERSENEFELVPQEVLAQEVLDAMPPQVRGSYESADTATLRKYAKTDQGARAVLILRGDEMD